MTLPIPGLDKLLGCTFPRRGSCMFLWGAPWHCPWPAGPCEVPGAGDTLLSCHLVTNAGTEERVTGGWWGLGELLWIGDGPVVGPRACGDTSVPLPVAPSGGRAVSWPATVAGTSLPCPGCGMVASGDSRWESRSLQLNWGQPPKVVAAPEARGLIAQLRGLRQGSVTGLVSPSWHMDGQGTCRVGSRRAGDKAGPLAGVAVATVSGCSSSTGTCSGHTRVQGFCLWLFLA